MTRKYDADTPLTDAEMKRMNWVKGTSALPKESRKAIKASTRGRPKSENPKDTISFRIDHDLLEAYKATGKGWQTRMHEILERNAP